MLTMGRNNLLLMVTLVFAMVLIGGGSMMVCTAAPLQTLEQGKVSIDAGAMISPDVDLSGDVGDYKIDGKTRFYGGVTAGLGNNFGVQYKYNDNRSKVWEGVLDGSVKSHELNLLYQINPNFTAFVGATHSKLELNMRENDYFYAASGDTSKTSFQVGILAQAQLCENLTAYGSIGLGTKTTAYELGLGYAVTKDIDFNAFYRSIDYKDFEEYGYKQDAKVDGFGLGLSLKFDTNKED